MRILLVEDEERMAQALCEILRQENYEVVLMIFFRNIPYPTTWLVLRPLIWEVCFGLLIM